MQIIVWEGKHANTYYDASTLEAWDKSAIRILQDLIDQQYLDPETYKPYISDKMRELAEIDLDELTNVTRSLVERDVLNARRSIESEERNYKYMQKQHTLALEYIEAGKSPVAIRGEGTRWEKKVPYSWILIEQRNGGEYERFELETVYQ